MSLLPRWFTTLPTKLGKGVASNISNFFEDFDEGLGALSSNPSGLSVYTDDNAIYVEAAVPGLKANEVDVSIDDDNVLWIKGQKKEEHEDKEKKYYRKALRSFSYCIPLTQEIEESIPTKAVCQDGIMKIAFKKKKTTEKKSRKIDVQPS